MHTLTMLLLRASIVSKEMDEAKGVKLDSK